MSGRLEILDTPLQGLKLVQRKPVADHRGYFERLFCSTELGSLLTERQIVQINHTLTRKEGAVRGLHFQRPPHSEIKMVSCLRGAVFDVAVDLRAGSSTFLQWHAEILSADNFHTMFVPEGFAHGFQTLAADCELVYMHTAEFRPSAEGGLNANDPMLSIKWPKLISDLSARDSTHPFLTADFAGVKL